MEQSEIQRRLDALGGDILGLLTILQAIAIASGKRHVIDAYVLEIAEVQRARLLASSEPETLLSQYDHSIAVFLDGLTIGT